MSEINITYETLFEVLRREKTRAELQELDSDFFDDVVSYVKEKTKAFDELKDKTDLFAADERLKAEKQLQNIKKIIKELYEKRERKIINLAIDSSRMFSSVIDKSAMLDEEKDFFEQILNLLNFYRKDLLFSILEARKPEIAKKEASKEKKTKGAEENKEEQEENTKAEENKEEQENDKSTIRFLYPVPKFVGRNLEEYGPFDKEDIAHIPNELANVLVEKGRAELLK